MSIIDLNDAPGQGIELNLNLSDVGYYIPYEENDDFPGYPNGSTAPQTQPVQQPVPPTQQTQQVQQAQAPVQPPERFDFHGLDEIDKVPLPTWLVKPIIIENGVGQIWGASGSTKSFLAIDLAMHVAHGWEWFGHKVKRRPVRYLVLEGGQGFVSMRLRAYRQIVSEATNGYILNGDFKYYIGNLALMDGSEVAQLATKIPEGALVFVDTQAQATAGVEENTSQLGIAIRNVQWLSQERKCTIALIHHSGKDVSKGSRGWSGQGGAWDFEISVAKSENKVYTWTVKKVKDAEDGEQNDYTLMPVCLKNMDGSLLLDEDGDTVTSCVVSRIIRDKTAQNQKQKQLPASLQFALDTFDEALKKNNNGEKSVHLEAWRSIFYTKSTGDNIASKRQAFNRARKDLERMGKLYVNNDFYSLESFTENTDAVDNVPHTGQEKVEVNATEKTKPLTDSQQLALDTFNKALEQCEGEKTVDLESWRNLFYAKHTGDNIKSKSNAFKKARERLVALGKLYVNNDVYSLEPFTENTDAVSNDGGDNAENTTDGDTDTVESNSE